MSFWSNLWGKDPKELFLEFTPKDASFVSTSWNFDLKDPGHRQWALEVHKDKKEVIEWKKAKSEEVSFFHNDRLTRKRRIPPLRKEYISLMNIAMHSTIMYGLEVHKEFIISPVSGATTQDFQNEARALQWIQATFGTLSRVLEKFKEDSSLIMTAAFFSGINPETRENVIRLIAFNLDIIFYLKPDATLQIIVFDDKNQGHGSAGAPTFQQIIKVTKPQFYDEMVKLTNQLAKAGELS